MNTDIKELLKEYQMDGDYVHNRVVGASFKYVSTMKDSQVRCLLYLMARQLETLSESNKGK